MWCLSVCDDVVLVASRVELEMSTSFRRSSGACTDHETGRRPETGWVWHLDLISLNNSRSICNSLEYAVI